MNKDERAHPNDEELLLYLDGELECGPSDWTRGHLDSCWTCRMRASSIQATILEFAKERERSGVPEPPAAWRDLSGDFNRIHALARPPSLLKRITTGVLFRNGRVAIFAAVTAAAAAVGWFALPRESAVARSSISLPDASAPSIEPSAPAPVPLPAPKMQFTPASIHDELAVIAELHGLRADLGEPVDLERTKDDHLILKASGLEPRRAVEIRKVMAKFPDLQFQLSEAHQQIASSANARSESARRPVAFEQELTRYAGGREPLQNLANDVLDASDKIAMYAHALDKIDLRFRTRQLAFEPQDYDMLNKIRSDYQSGARQALQSLRTLMDPLFRELDIEPRSATPQSNPLETALETDRLTNAAFAGAQSDLSDKNIYQNLRASIARLVELSE